MSLFRLALTTAGLAAVGVLLTVLAPPPSALGEALRDPQRVADTAGADVLTLVLVGALAWAVWAWGALGLLLTAAAVLPGPIGSLAGALVRVVLPAGARRAAGVLLGVGVAVGVVTPALLPVGPPVAPAAASSPVSSSSTSMSAAGSGLSWPGPGAETPAGRAAGSLAGRAAGVLGIGPPDPAAQAGVSGLSRSAPDWPGGAAAPTASGPTGVPDWPGAPDWPDAPAAGDHVVLHGDCLWQVAADWLQARTRTPPTDAQVADAVAAWWATNRAVIGTDPDLLLPGQVLHPPTESGSPLS